MSLHGKICLAIPPSAFLLDERVFVPLGLLKVASSLEAAGHGVSVLDLSGIANFQDALRHYLHSEKPAVIGLTATTPQLPAVFEVLKVIRAEAPEARVILGGPHVTLTYAAVKQEKMAGREHIGRAARAAKILEDAFDTLVSGDGEHAILHAIRPDAPKVIDADDRKGPFFMSNDDYELTPMAARHLVDMESYKYKIEGHPSTSLIAQLGCPFSCGFCGGRFSNSLRVTRNRSSQSVVDEVEHLYRAYGYTGFMFYDDELNVAKSMVDTMNGLRDLQERLGVSFRLRGFVKAELLTDIQAHAMYAAGFRWLLCGFEAANPRILTNIEKRATLDDNNRAVEIAKRNGLKVKALMSIGHPGESPETVLDIKDWLIANEVDDFDCTIITTYPGTPYYDRAVPHETRPGVWTYTQKQTGDRLHAHEVDFTTTADYYKGDPDGGYKSFVFTDHISAEQLVEMRDKVERETREKLGIRFNPGRAALRFEHSMGQGLPGFILRHSEGGPPVPAPGSTRQSAAG